MVYKMGHKNYADIIRLQKLIHLLLFSLLWRWWGRLFAYSCLWRVHFFHIWKFRRNYYMNLLLYLFVHFLIARILATCLSLLIHRTLISKHFHLFLTHLFCYTLILSFKSIKHLRFTLYTFWNLRIDLDRLYFSLINYYSLIREISRRLIFLSSYLYSSMFCCMLDTIICFLILWELISNFGL